MQYITDDVRITGMEEVSPPQELIDEIPIASSTSELIYSLRQQASDIIAGRDDRLLIIVGPCSIHEPKSALEYAEKLAFLSDSLKDQLCILMRVYFEKPRTTVGWKGLINDPYLNGSCAINDGLRTARHLLADIAKFHLGVGTEYLDPITPQYLGDLISWSAIGARTTESQIHRQLASGLSCPVGFKNSTKGDVQIAVDAVESARHSHVFLSVTKAGHSAIFSTAGNPDCHIILRGGGGDTNYDTHSIEDSWQRLTAAGLGNKVMVDMSHANSEKEYVKQLDVCESLCSQLERGNTKIIGVMLESHLVEGKQDIGDGNNLNYGQSITDACLGWNDTVACLENLYKATKKRKRN